ncbi:hypothetical protein IGI04_043091, partial [Brassica rapa subsp. trilocularis]
QDVDIKETINKDVKTEERWAVWSWIVTGPNGWEDFESYQTRDLHYLNGFSTSLRRFQTSIFAFSSTISHSYALHSSRVVLYGQNLSFRKALSQLLNGGKKPEERGETSSGHKKKLKGDLTGKQLVPIQVVHCLTSDQNWSLQVVDSLLHYSVPTGSKKLSSKCTKISLSLTEDDDDDPVVS